MRCGFFCMDERLAAAAAIGHVVGERFPLLARSGIRVLEPLARAPGSLHPEKWSCHVADWHYADMKMREVVTQGGIPF